MALSLFFYVYRLLLIFFGVCVAAGMATPAATYTGSKNIYIMQRHILDVRTRYTLPVVLRIAYEYRSSPVQYKYLVPHQRMGRLTNHVAAHTAWNRNRRTGGNSCSCLNGP